MPVRLAVFLLPFWVFLADGIAILLIGSLGRLVRSPANILIVRQMEELPLFNVSMRLTSFVVVLISVLIYFYPGRREFPTALARDYSRRFKVRIMNAPLALSFIGSLGWLAGSLVYLVLGHAANLPNPVTWGFAFSTMILSFVMQGTTFTIGYYAADLWVRKFLVRELFPDGELMRTPGIYRLSLRERFFLFLFAAVVLPGIVFLKLLWNLNNEGLNSYGEDRAIGILVLTGAVFLTGLVITLLKARAIQKPILRLEEATRIMRGGEYGLQLPVASTDEIGRLTEGVNQLSRDLQEREKLREVFGKIVDPSVRDHLLSEDLKLGGETRELTILFSDLKAFSELSARYAPEEMVAILNLYFDRMTRAVTENGGVVNKYIGDGIMAVFGAPMPLKDHARAAVAAALDMRRAQVEINEELSAKGVPPLHTRIGIHTGEVLAGNIGSRKRMEYTVIGDPVNTAARLEQLGKQVDHDILISGEVRAHLNGEFSASGLGPVQLKGVAHPVDVYKVN